MLTLMLIIIVSRNNDFYYLEAKPSAEDLEFMRQVCEELSDEGRNSVSGSNTVKRLVLKISFSPYSQKTDYSTQLPCVSLWLGWSYTEISSST